MNSRFTAAKQAYIKGLNHFIETYPDNNLTAKFELETADRLWHRVEREGVTVHDGWIGIRIAAKLLNIPNTDASWKAYLTGARAVRGSLGG